MKVLVACEVSGVVRDAFRHRGHDAWSCDLLPSKSQWHIQADVLDLVGGGSWDIMIAHPPCTHLATSGARWFKGKPPELQAKAIEFVERLWTCKIPRVAIENPICVLARRSILGPPTQVIQPWQFGHGEQKATCLWLRGLPKLKKTHVVTGREQRIHKMPHTSAQAAKRSVFYKGFADAMADQWTKTDRLAFVDTKIYRQQTLLT